MEVGTYVKSVYFVQFHYEYKMAKYFYGDITEVIGTSQKWHNK